jgi:hypothetical protein
MTPTRDDGREQRLRRHTTDAAPPGALEPLPPGSTSGSGPSPSTAVYRAKTIGQYPFAWLNVTFSHHWRSALRP